LMKLVNEEVWMSLKYRGDALSSPEMPLSQIGTPPKSTVGDPREILMPLLTSHYKLKSVYGDTCLYIQPTLSTVFSTSVVYH
jgi:hypothetical protein